ncbi:hypothetical protein POM88_029654 [Heracleum sosnowskyi]|uniref:Uncharacterized protein n=1 Tax=Heracleum sosnowskyi TaxID=360622 RepID=A0AAD8HUH3_9APIA|nr:hypothetical protein POM88_029654 [Heracleum sosnowskyi]
MPAKVVALYIRLPKQSNIGHVLDEIKTKVCLNSSDIKKPSSAASSSVHAQNQRQVVVCKVVSSNEPPFPALTLSKRNMSIGLTTTFLVSLAGKALCSDANAAILEADDDIELLEKVKKDRQKRLEKQGVISSSDKERGYVQDLVYKLSKVGQAIEKMICLQLLLFLVKRVMRNGFKRRMQPSFQTD